MINEKKVREAVRALREHLGLNQPDFARRMEISLATVQAYEQRVRPKSIVLGDFVSLAESEGLPDLANIFREALVDDLGPNVLLSLGINKNPVKSSVDQSVTSGLHSASSATIVVPAKQKHTWQRLVAALSLLPGGLDATLLMVERMIKDIQQRAESHQPGQGHTDTKTGNSH